MAKQKQPHNAHTMTMECLINKLLLLHESDEMHKEYKNISKVEMNRNENDEEIEIESRTKEYEISRFIAKLSVYKHRLKQHIEDIHRRILKIEFYQKDSQVLCYGDNILVEDESLQRINDGIDKIHKAFESPDLIEYDESAKQFKFQFADNENTVQYKKYVSLRRKGRNKFAARKDINYLCSMRRIQNETSEDAKDDDIDDEYVEYVSECLNLHQVDEESYDYEVTFTLQPGKYNLFIGDLFDKNNAITLCIKDYKTMKKHYEKCRDYLVQKKILSKYFKYLKRTKNEKLIKEWNRFKCEGGLLMKLKGVMCGMDKYDDDIPQQTVCDFICLSIQYHLRRIDSFKQNDRILLSMIVKYFQMDIADCFPSLGVDKCVLPSGLFSMFQGAMSATTDQYDAASIDFEPLKKELKSVRKETYFVVYISGRKNAENVMCFFREVSKNEFYANSIYNMDKLEFINGKFHFPARKINFSDCEGYILRIVDNYDCWDWALWIAKRLDMYPDTRGYWMLQDPYDDPRQVLIPSTHLDAISALLKRDPSRNMSRQNMKFIFLNGEQTTYYNEHILSEYEYIYSNEKRFGNIALSLKIIKTMRPNTKDRPKKRYNFLYFRSTDDINWSHYDGTGSEWIKHSSYYNKTLLKQIECSYQAVITFPVNRFSWTQSSSNNEKEKRWLRIFNDAQFPELAKLKRRIFILRFNFILDVSNEETNKISSIEQIEVNGVWDQYPSDVRREYMGNNSILSQQQKLYNLGILQTEMIDGFIVICIKFKENSDCCIRQNYHFRCQIAEDDQNAFVRLLAYWKRDNLFERAMVRNELKISQSKMSKNDKILNTQLELVDSTSTFQCEERKKAMEVLQNDTDKVNEIKTFKDLLKTHGK